jgi:hypothetical protein
VVSPADRFARSSALFFAWHPRPEHPHLSEGGAKLEIGPASPIPDHFFLVLGAFEFYIGSQIVERKDGFAHVCFIKELQPRFVNQISRLKDTDACLEPLGRDFKQFTEGGGV